MEINTTIFATIVLALLISSPAVTQSHLSCPPSSDHHVNLSELLAISGPFNTFLNYLLQTKVIQIFQNQADNTAQGITIFAPNNSVFATLEHSTFSSLTQGQLSSLLLYHALPKYYSILDLKNMSSFNINAVTTLAGGDYTLKITEDMGLIYVGSRWTNPKITCIASPIAPVAIFEIDEVLLPMDIFSSEPTLAPTPALDPESIKPSDMAPSTGSGFQLSPISPPPTSSSSSNIITGVGDFLGLVVSSSLLLLLTHN